MYNKSVQWRESSSFVHLQGCFIGRMGLVKSYWGSGGKGKGGGGNEKSQLSLTPEAKIKT